MLTETTKREGNGAAAEHTLSGPYYRPAVDILERGDELVLVVDLPGVAQDAVDIDYNNGTLTIQGRAPERQDDKTSFIAREYGVGDFQRVFQVGDQIDPAKIAAELAHGVLTLRLPKAESAKPRKIVVQAK